MQVVPGTTSLDPCHGVAMSRDTSPPDAMIDLIKVSKTYVPDVQALTDISLTIRRGERVFLTGMSGAGKTTLLRLISGMEKPSKGMLDVAGFDLAKLPPRKLHLLRRRIGMAYQDFKLLPDRTVADNIAIAMEVTYTPRATIERRTRELLAQLELSHKYKSRTSELSRGEQQRVTIARAVANNPEIVLADEPTGNLDGETTGRVMELFQQLNHSGTTLLIATHDTSLYQRDRDRVIELHHGRLRLEQLGEGGEEAAPDEADLPLAEEV